ncbi:MAG: NAD(P)/FAD-dependent oxidoreductase [Candidatus Competibacterales bacterium]
MTNPRLSRRDFVAGAGVALGLGLLPPPSGARQSDARVVVIGGGFGGASFARFARRADPGIDVTLVEPQTRYAACPFSNLVLGGLRALDQQYFDYAALTQEDIRVLQGAATDVDPAAKTVTVDNGEVLAYDRLLMAPGVEMRPGALAGYDGTAVEAMPHAWKAGPQTALLRRQLEAMDDGGLVVIACPASPYRCPPGPYERASLIAHYLKTHKPRSKLLILDANDNFSKQGLFQQAWGEIYGDMIEWVGVSMGGQVVEVDAAPMTLHTDFEAIHADVANVIPPQRATAIARRAGVADATGWCPIDPLTFESTLVAGIHVIGDAAIANAMPKSAFSANAQAKVCAVQVARLLADQPPLATTLANTCYSLVAPDYAISVAGVYRPGEDRLESIEGAGGTSPADAPLEQRATEARYAADWFATITTEVFG